MKFYRYSQNNSGGSFEGTSDLGEEVYIEARTADKSKEVAFKLGIYLDGVADGTDCSCCGDRWSEPDELNFPHRFGTYDKEEAEKFAKKYKADFRQTTWKFRGTEDPDPDEYDLVFRDIESFAQFQVDEWVWSNGYGVIHYANGKKKKIAPNKDN